MFVILFYMKGSFPEMNLFQEVMKCGVIIFSWNRTDGATNGHFSENTKC